MSNKGKIFNIQRFSAVDGPGIRTVVFLKGCPLNCIWCHNPESKERKSEILYNSDMCIGCGACADICSEQCHTFVRGIHNFPRVNCQSCGDCVKVCPSNALKLCGEKVSAEKVIADVLRDKSFYDESGGGVTLSGGEPLLQYGFTLSLLKLAKKQGLHTAVETSGFTEKNLYELNKYTDLWLYDIKVFSDEEHIKYTGFSNKNILKNLCMIDNMGAKIILRCPIIPNVNFCESHLFEIARLANKLNGVSAVHLEPYHPLGISKAQQLCKKQVYQNNSFLDSSLLSCYVEKMRFKTDKEIIVL